MRDRPVLFFDVMDTLVVDPIHEHIPAFFGVALDPFFRDKHPTAWIEFELGKLSPAAYYSKMFADKRTVDGAALERHLAGAYTWIEGMEALLAELGDAGFELHALSNYPVWYRIVEQTLGLSRYLAWTFVSCRTGRRKPAPEAYVEAARELGRAPDTCLFIDDRAVNCDAARAAGMPAIRFESATSLRRQLAAMIS